MIAGVVRDHVLGNILSDFCQSLDNLCDCICSVIAGILACSPNQQRPRQLLSDSRRSREPGQHHHRRANHGVRAVAAIKCLLLLSVFGLNVSQTELLCV